MSSPRSFRSWALRAYLVALVGFGLLPIVVLVLFSFHAGRFARLPWQGFDLVWYREVLDDRGTRAALINSVVVAVQAAALSTLIGFAAAYGLRGATPAWLRRSTTALALLPAFAPLLVLGLTMAIFFRELDLAGDLRAVVIAHTVISCPLVFTTLQLRLLSLEPELERAAWNLGATPWRTFVSVVLPNVRGALAGAYLLAVALSFGEFIVAWFLSGARTTAAADIFARTGGAISPVVNALAVLLIAAGVIAAGLGFALVSGARAWRRASDPSLDLGTDLHPQGATP